MSNHTDELKDIKEQLANLILNNEPELVEQIFCFDEKLLTMLREVGRDVMTNLSNELCKREEEKLRLEKMTVQERKTTPFLPFLVRSK